MSARKKKSGSSPKKEDSEDTMDIFTYIELIEGCLEKAESTEVACLDGIKKADRVLGQTTEDPDIQCIVLIKRAELLYIAVKNGYNTGELYKQPVESCIEDCEMVLSKVSAANGTGRGLIETAKSLLDNAQKLRKTLQKEARAKRLKHTSVERVSKPVIHRYDPTKTVFKDVNKINPHLIQDIVESFQEAKKACRFCYYKLKRVEEISGNRFCKNCKKSGPSLVIIPASTLCRNLADSEEVAISSPPKMLMARANRHKPFLMCKNKEHTVCMDKASVGIVWFAHSIEELVVWTVERYYNCSFEEFIKSEYDGPIGRRQDSASKAGALKYNYDDYDDEDEEYDYYPEDCIFKNMAAIPQILLLDVIELYRQAKNHCKWCFYIRSKNGFIKFDKSFNMNVCSTCHNEWEPVIVIPASKLCWNFGKFDFVPIAPLPVGKSPSSPFEYCQKVDHYRCFKVYTDSTFWYPHSVEEMIIWTVERDKNCKFSEFIENISRIPEGLDVSPKGHSSTAPSKQIDNKPSTAVPSKAIPVKTLPKSTVVTDLVKQDFQYASLSTMQSNVPLTPLSIAPGLPRRVDPIGTHPGSRLPASLYGFRPPVRVTPVANHPLGMPSTVTMNPLGMPGSVNGGPNGVHKHPGNSTYEVQASHTPLSAVISPTSSTNPAYKLGEVSFTTVAEIPPELLKGISACFLSKKEVCRICFYEERQLSDIVQATNTCNGGNHPWSKPLLVIEGCALCDNEPCYSRGEAVPIPPLPPVATIKKCPQTNHHKCYSKALKANEMHAHSIEALVVWIVESEQECLFQEYVSQKFTTKNNDPINKSVQKPTTTSNGVFAVNQSPVISLPAAPILIGSVPPLAPQSAPQLATKLHDPRDTEFSSIDDVPPELLSAVAECFKSCTHVCRVCFFDSNCKSLIQKVEMNKTPVCPSGHNPWREVRVIPKCKLCVNQFDWIPIPPLPKHMKQKPKNPFVMCKKSEHSSCYTMSKGTDPWFPHTVEEMVIWTVEREIDRKYEEVYQQFLGTRRPYARPKKPIEVVNPSTLQPVDVSNRPKRPSRAITIIDPSTKEPVTQNSQLNSKAPSTKAESTSDTGIVNEEKPVISVSTKEPSPVPASLTIQPTSVSLQSEAAAPSSDSQSQSIDVPITPARAHSNILSMEVQSPTLNQDLEAAIKFANTSLASTAQSELPKQQPLITGAPELTDQMFSAFPGMLSSLFPNGGNKLANTAETPEYLSIGAGLQDTDLARFFPALSQTDGRINTSSIHPITDQPVLNRNNTDMGINHPLNERLTHNTNTSNIGINPPINTKSVMNPMEVAGSIPSAHPPVKLVSQGRMPPPREPRTTAAGVRSEGPLPVFRMPASVPQVLHSQEAQDKDDNFVPVTSKTYINTAKKIETPTEPEIVEDPQDVLEDDGFTQVKSKKLKRFLKKVEAPAPVVEITKQRPRFVSSELDEFDSDLDDKNESSKGDKSSTSNSQSLSNELNSNSSHSLSSGTEPDISIFVRRAMKSTSCLACYKPFSTHEQLKSHCESKGHSTNVLRTIGQHKIPKYPPPHPAGAAKRVCKKRGCNGAPECVLAHHQDQLSSWQQNWGVILNTKSRSRPQHISHLTTGLLLSQDPRSSQYEGVIVNVSRACSEVIKPGQETSLEWKITLQGQNWQTLFGVQCHAAPNPRPGLRGPVFILSAITSESNKLGICGPLWEASSVRSGFFLGRVVLTVTARLSAMSEGATESCELRLNLGYKEFLFLPLSVRASADRSPPRLFVPQHGWDLSHGSSSPDELGILSMDQESQLQHVPIEDWSGSLTGDNAYLK